MNTEERRATGRGERRERGPSYDAVCEQCQVHFRVPFEPTQGRALLCRQCLKGGRKRLNAELDPEAHQIVCSHCGKHDSVPFRPYEGSAVLCRDCMNNPNIERVGGKIMHAIICSTCGQKNSVPFKPDPGSRVLCRNCHMQERAEKKQAREYFAKHHPNIVHNTRVRIEIRCDRCGAEDNLPFVPKTQGLILCRQCAENTFGDAWAKRNKLGAQEYPFACVRCGKQDFVSFKPLSDHKLLCKHCLNDQAIIKRRRQSMERHDAFSLIHKSEKANEALERDEAALLLGKSEDDEA